MVHIEVDRMTIDQRLEALTMNLELMSHSHEALVQKQARDHNLLAQKQARYHGKTESLLRRAIAASVKEARQERQKGRELDAKTSARASDLAETMAQLARAQVISEKKLTRLEDLFLNRGKNGKH